VNRTENTGRVETKVLAYLHIQTDMLIC